MRRRFALLGLLLAALPLVACGTQGEECDPCTKDSDCKGGFVCSMFSDGIKRCGTGNTASPTQCRIRP